VIVGTHKGVECRFYFDPSESRLLALEMFPDNESDPCEIYFSHFTALDSREMPCTISVRFGDENISELSLHEFRIEKNVKPEEKMEPAKEKNGEAVK
jgi:hypothetical protein